MFSDFHTTRTGGTPVSRRRLPFSGLIPFFILFLLFLSFLVSRLPAGPLQDSANHGHVALAGAAELTSAQIVDLIQATKAKYRTFTTRSQVVAYQRVGQEWPSQPYMTTSELWRSDGTRQFFNEALTWRKNLNGPFPPPVVSTYSFGPTWSKSLVRQPGSAAARGTIRQPLARANDASLADQLWGLLNEPWSAFSASETTAAFDEKTGLWCLRTIADPDGYKRVLFVDKSLGYLPVRFSIFRKDGISIGATECSQFSIVDGLPIPHMYTYEAALAGCRVVSTYDSIEINRPIDPAAFDLDFPDGTQVEDEIANLKYDMRHGLAGVFARGIAKQRHRSMAAQSKTGLGPLVKPKSSWSSLRAIIGAAVAVVLATFTLYGFRRRLAGHAHIALALPQNRKVRTIATIGKTGQSRY